MPRRPHPIVVLALAAAAAAWPLHRWVDRPALAFFFGYDGTIWEAPAEAVTELGNWTAWMAAACLAAAGAALLRRPGWRDGCAQLAAALLLAGLAGTALKVLFGQPGPEAVLAGATHDFTWLSLAPDRHAFPSGHALTAGAVAATAWLRGLRGRGAVAVAAATIAATRFATSVHFVSDVVAGLAVGALAALAVERAADRLRAGRRAAAPAGLPGLYPARSRSSNQRFSSQNANATATANTASPTS
jgi:undecaprenyl-diphosphatase